jgi:hypothetical protein
MIFLIFKVSGASDVRRACDRVIKMKNRIIKAG